MGNVDTSRASRFILKDYVTGKLLYCHPPPSTPAAEFNAELHDLDLLRAQGKLRKKRAPTTRVPFKADTYIPQAGERGAETALSTTRQSARALALDRNFFAGTLPGRPGVRGVAGEKNGAEFSRVKMFAHQGKVQPDGTVMPVKSGRASKKAAAAAAAEAAGAAVADGSDKRHFKEKRQKKRSGRGYDDF